jgi:hypothetical protein
MSGLAWAWEVVSSLRLCEGGHIAMLHLSLSAWKGEVLAEEPAGDFRYASEIRGNIDGELSEMLIAQ